MFGYSGEVYAERVESSQSDRFDAVAMRAVEKMPLAVFAVPSTLNRYLILLDGKIRIGVPTPAPELALGRIRSPCRTPSR